MKLHEYKKEWLKRNHNLMLVGVNATISKLNEKKTLAFYFVDEKNCMFSHFQICESETCDLQIRKYFASLGFNMVKHSPLDLFYDWRKCQNSKDRDALKESIVGKALGRIYRGKIAVRNMKWEQKIDGIRKTVKRKYWDVDYIYPTENLIQKVQIEDFKKKSTVPNGENVYDWWMGKGFSISEDFEINAEKENKGLFAVKPTWKMTEEEILGSVQPF